MGIPLDLKVESAKEISDISTFVLNANNAIETRIEGIARILGLYADAGGETGIPGVIKQRKDTSRFYSLRGVGMSRQVLNNRAYEILNRVEAEGIPEGGISDEDKEILAQYSGCGGNMTGRDGKKGSAYEYYTPKPIAEGIWDAVKIMGFSGGKVLDPCSGTGIFGATAPLNAAIEAVELSKDSGTINKLLNDGVGYLTHAGTPFERFAINSEDESFDAVVSNVPFGNSAARGANASIDPRYSKEDLSYYFLMRSMEKLRPGGMAAFITPMKCMTGRSSKDRELRLKLSYMAEFVGAYRLPSGTFSQADTNTATDVMFFKKYDEETHEKIEGLRASNPDVLRDSMVVWDDFIEGKYFNTSEGRPYQLGEFKPKDPNNKFSRDEVIYTGGNILADFKEIIQKKRLPKSRIKWDMLEATETKPIEYKDGDHIQHAGQTLVMRGGVWEVEESSNDDANKHDVTQDLQIIDTPLSLFESGKDFVETTESLRRIMNAGRTSEIPDWVTTASKQLINMGINGSKANGVWEKIVCALAVSYVLEYRSGQKGVNFSTEYPSLTEAMKRLNPGAEGKNWKGELKEAARVALLHYSSKKGYSSVWTGSVNEEVTKSEALKEAEKDPDVRYAGLRYKTKSVWATLDQLREIYGNDFDPYASSDWCISADGTKIASAGDYYVGSYDDLMVALDGQIKNATDEKIREKLINQRLQAEKRVRRVDAATMNFTLSSPLVTAEEKVAFLKQYVSKDAYVNMDNGVPAADIDVKSKKTLDDRLFNRIGKYARYGSVSLGLKIDDPAEKKKAIDRLKFLVAQTDQQFDAWCHANPDIMSRINGTMNSGSALRFIDPDDEVSFAIPGMRPELQLHGYQASYVRKMGREFSGINGFGVGLGKTFTALASVQHVQAIGVKKKTLFVVPNAVLSNWKKEASRAYTSVEDCLFIGLREADKGSRVQSSQYDVDLMKIRENKHSKIFMTMEAFQRIKLTEATVDKYLEHLKKYDPDLADSVSKKDSESAASKLDAFKQSLMNKTGAAPYLEDLGVDSIVMDEAHCYKNSVNAKFKKAKYLSISEASACGLDAQAKNWFIRGGNENGDGVLMLTATPLTNSPLEIYSMLALAVGEERVGELIGGGKGGAEFLKIFANTNEENGINVAGQDVIETVFTGLKSVSALRRAVGDVVTMKTAQEVGAKVVIPEREETTCGVKLSRSTLSTMNEYRGAYIYAKLDADDRMLLMETDPEYYKEIEANYKKVSEETGAPESVIGHPFSLIQRMSDATIDPELTREVSVYVFDKEQLSIAEKVVKAFGKLKKTEERKYLSQEVKASKYKEITKTETDANGEDVEKRTIYQVQIQATIKDETIEINSLSPDMQDAFEAIAEKEGLTLDVHDSEKLSALIANVQKEMALPRGVNSDGEKSNIVKQIIFCDAISTHNKIKRLLTNRCGVPSSKIAIITGQKNGSPEAIMDVQEGFNSDGEENRYSIIIANKKAEVGINLQKGTQAIHHLTIGWTPDSIEQRNGRGARQGNKTSTVSIYYYDAEGTFDEMKRMTVDKKSDWINDVVSDAGKNEVSIAGGLSDEEYDALIRANGNKEMFDKLVKEKEEREKEARKQAKISRQKMVVNTIESQTEFIKKMSDLGAVNLERVATAFYHCFKYKKAQEKGKEGKELVNAKRNAEYWQDYCERNFVLTPIVWSSSQEQAPVDFKAAYHHCCANTFKSTATIQRMIDTVKYRLTIEFKETSEEAAKVAKEIETAKNVLELSKKEFLETGEVEGGLPKDFLSKWEDGSARVLDGRYYLMDYAFIKYPDGGLSYLEPKVGEKKYGEKTWGVAADSALGRDAGEYVRISEFPYKADKAITPEMIVLPGTEGYEDCLKRVAVYEESMMARNLSGDKLSDKVPAILKYIENTKAVAYDEYTMLDSPYFPYVISDKAARHSPLLAKAQEKQKEVIHTFPRVDVGDSFVTHNALDSVEKGSVELCGLALYEYAKANGQQLPWSIFDDTHLEGMCKLLVGRIDISKHYTPGTMADLFKQTQDAIVKELAFISFDDEEYALERLANNIVYQNEGLQNKIKEMRYAFISEGLKADDLVKVKNAYDYDFPRDIREHVVKQERGYLLPLKFVREMIERNSYSKSIRYGREIKDED